MRDAVIDGEFEHLRIDHDQPALLGLEPVEQAQDHGVDGDRLARAGGAGDQQMRHAREVDDHRLAADGLAEAERQLGGGVVVVLGGEQLAEEHLLAVRVGQLDADGVASRHHGDARRQRAHGTRDVVGEADHARRLDAGRGLELVERHHRARPRIDDLAAHAEIVEHAFERGGVGLQRFRAERRAPDRLRHGEQIERRELVTARLARRFGRDLRGLARRARGASSSPPPRRPRPSPRRAAARAWRASRPRIAAPSGRGRSRARRGAARPFAAPRPARSREMRAFRLRKPWATQPSETHARSSSSSFSLTGSASTGFFFFFSFGGLCRPKPAAIAKQISIAKPAREHEPDAGPAAQRTAGQPGRQPHERVADHAAEPGRQRPGCAARQRGRAAGRERQTHDPEQQAQRLAVEPAMGDEPPAPDRDRQHERDCRDHRASASADRRPRRRACRACCGSAHWWRG